MGNKSESKTVAVKTPTNTRWDEQWMRQYEFLVRYRAKNAKEWPSTLEEFPKGNHLGQWVHRQRELQNTKLLPQDRMKLLKKLGLPWEKPDERASHWQMQFQYLSDYRRAHPKSWPFAREDFPKGNRLGLWVWRQRQNFANGQLSKERQRALAKLEFPFSLPDTWAEHYQTLKDYRKQYPQNWPKAREEFPKGNRLGLWCHLQRCALKADSLLPERVAKLNKIGFVWSVKDLSWNKFYAQLSEYKKKNPTKWPLLDSTALKDKRIIAWCSAQRHKCKLKILDKEKIRQLDKLDFRW